MAEQKKEAQKESQETAEKKLSPDNLLTTLRSRRQEIGEAKSVDLEVPGYDGALVIRYGKVDWDELRRIAGKAQKSKSPRRELNAQADTLVAACQEVLIRVGEELLPITEAFPEADTGEPVRFDDRLAKALEFEAPNARAVVFGTYNNDLAVTLAHNDLTEWMRNSNQEEDEDF
jgi:hypothetical protein